MTRTCLAGFLVFLLGTCLADATRADVVAPEVATCNALSADAACSNGTGTCQPTTCYRLDYGSWDRDASASPPSISYDCLTCVANGDQKNKDDSSGCAVGGRFASTAGPWLLAGAFGACVMLLRRRPRR